MGIAPLKIMIVDDSPLFRKVLKSVIQGDPRFEIVGTARNGQDALNQLPDRRPDAVILDVQMPVMDGLTTLEHLHRVAPDVGVIMFSALTRVGAEATVRALELGAFDFVAKSESSDAGSSTDIIRHELIPKLTFLHTRKALRLVAAVDTAEDTPDLRAAVEAVPRPAPIRPPRLQPSGRKLVAIGISTGGPQALARIWPALPADLNAAVLVVQHMPPVFTASLAQRLNELSPLETREAADGDEVCPGLALLAPGGMHMTVVADSEGRHVVRLVDDPPEHNCRPSVDVLFRSVAREYGPDAVGLIMTGMGTDGTIGLRMMKERGAYIIAQNRATCTVYGMPKKAVEEKMAHEVLPLDEIVPAVKRLVAE